MKSIIVIKGVTWQVISQVACQMLSIVSTAILARLLTPESYGLVALAAVFLGLGGLFTNLGMAVAVIQKKEIDDEILSTAFWTSMCTGFVIGSIVICSSFPIALYYSNDTLQLIIIVSSVNFFVGPLGTIHSTLLNRHLEFKKIAFIQLFERFASVVISVLLAFWGWGVWSLVLGGLFSNMLNIPIYWFVVPWRPKFIFKAKSFHDLFGFGSRILAFDMVNYIARNADNFLIGKMLGSVSLGYYSIAYQVMMKPLQQISWSVARVLFPVLSSIQDEKNRVAQGYIRVTRAISMITFPMMFGLMAVAPEFVLTYYGSKWEEAILPVQLLCSVGALQSIGTNVGSVFLSQGRADLHLRFGTINSIVIVLSFVVGLQWGLKGLIVGYMIASLIAVLYTQYYALKLIHMSLESFLLAVVPASISTLMMLVILYTFRYFNKVYFGWNIYVTLIVMVLVGTVTYALFLLTFFGKIDDLQDAKAFVIKKILNLRK